MWIYIFTFCSSALLIRLIEKKPKKSLGFVFGSFLALLIPCLVAAFRDVSIGTDTAGYLSKLYRLAGSSESLGDFYTKRFLISWRYISTNSYEPAFTLIVYATTKIFKSISAVFFVIETLILVPVYAVLCKYRDRLSISFGMLVFYFLFYNANFNALRQWIALAVLLYGFSYMQTNNLRKYVFTVILAMLFHTSAIIGIVIYVMYRFINNDSKKPLSLSIGHHRLDVALSKSLFVIACEIMGLLSISLLGILLSRTPLYRYVGYIVRQGADLKFMPNQIIAKIPMVILMLLCWRRVSKEKEMPFFLCMLVTDMITCQLASVNEFSGRIGTYFFEYAIFAFPLICRSFKTALFRRMVYIYSASYVVIYWVFYYIYNNQAETFPYISVFGN